MTAIPKPAATATLTVVYDGGQRCIGHVLSRGKKGVEGFDWRDKSIGIFPTMKLAASAVSCAFHDGGER
jgi:hypothetical protein